MRPVSEKAQREAQRRSSNALFPCLIKITHSYAGITSPLLFCNNTVALVYNEETYYPLNFDFTMPGRSEDGTKQNARLIIGDVDSRSAEIVMSVATPITIEAIAAFRIDESGTVTFESLASYDTVLRNVTGTEDSLSGELVYEARLDLEYPLGDMNPNDFPGLF